MNIWRFFLDQWRLALFYFLGIGLTLTVFRLALGFLDVAVPLGDVAYASLLAVACFLAYGVIEYVIRRPFYREAQTRLCPDSPFHSADTFHQSATAEQRLFLELLHQHYRSYARELTALQERSQFYEVFTLRFAHQMKTPVTVLQLLEQELKSELSSGSLSFTEWIPKLDTMAEECQQLNQSLNTMIHTARLRSFEFDSHMEEVEFLGLLREVINSHKSEWIRKSIFPKIISEEQVVPVASDKKWLHFMVDQIVRNGLQYGVRDGRETHGFEIRVQSTTTDVTIEFHDEGIGIPEKDLHRVFDPFFTGENGRSHSRSTGMGLYLVREVADELGHSVSIRSREGQGTAVALVIPKPGFHSPAISPSNAGPNMTIL